MEFVVVTFATARAVNVDGAARGQTGQRLRMQAGTHRFDLGLPLNYSPPSVMTPVRGTSAAAPMVIAFTAAGLQDGIASAAAPVKKRKRTAARKTVRKGTAQKGAARKAAAGARKRKKVR